MGGAIPTAAAVIFTGLLSVYGNRWTTEILDAFDDVPHGHIAWHAVVFFSATIVLAVIAILSVVANSLDRKDELAKREAADSREAEALARLERMMKTLPDERFLGTFQEIYKAISATVSDTLAGAPYLATDVSLLQKSVRVVLNGIASLAKAFDGTDSADSLSTTDRTVYGANIMVFYSPSDCTAEEVTDIKARLTFVDEALDFTALAGVLDLRSELSTSTDSDDPIADPGLRPLALPVLSLEAGPDATAHRQPGAPDAFVTGELQRFGSGDAFLAEVAKRDLTESVKKKIRRHFSESPELRVRSFISLLLEDPRSGEKVGVLNVHRSRQGILRDTNPQDHFVPVVSPLLLLLSQVLVQLLNVEMGRPPSTRSAETKPEAGAPEKQL